MVEARTRGAVKVKGGEFKVTGSRAQIAKYIFYAQIGLVGLLVAGTDQLLPQYVRENKFTVGIAVWFVGNILSSALTNTGAFEIYLGKQLVWSALKQGGLPNYQELLEAFAKHGLDLGVTKE